MVLNIISYPYYFKQHFCFDFNTAIPAKYLNVSEFKSEKTPLFKVVIYGTHCNIYSDERILKSDNNYAFKIFKFLTFAPKIPLLNSTKEIKSKTSARFNPQPMDC